MSPKRRGSIEHGATLVEYALLLSLIGLITLGSLNSFSSSLNGKFAEASLAVEGCPSGTMLRCLSPIDDQEGTTAECICQSTLEGFTEP
jgi:Flp pilus assembly pilin Flp